MKKRYVLLVILSILLIWILTGGNYADTINKPIKKITKTAGLYLFGKRKILTLSKEVKYYNQAKQLIKHDYYNKNDSVDSRYVYTYYSFDSVQTYSWLTGADLTAQRITEYKYDSLNRIIEESTCYINKSKYSTKKIGEIDYCTVDTHQYDALGNNNISVIGRSTFFKKYDSNGRLVQRIQSVVNKSDSSMYITNYFYDEQGFIKCKFGGLSKDSIYYKTNDKGQIVEEYEKYERYPDFISGNDKYWYDENGNKIKTILDIDGGLTYNFVYDKNNRILIEYRPWNLLGLVRGGVEYNYEYYD